MKHKNPWLWLQLPEKASVSLFPFESFPGFSWLSREQALVAALDQLQEVVLTSQHCKERFVSVFCCVWETSTLLLQHVVRISAWAGETRGCGKPGRFVSGLLVEKVEEDEGVWCLPRSSVNQMYLTKVVNHLIKMLVDTGWWTGDWHSKRSSVVLLQQQINYPSASWEASKMLPKLCQMETTKQHGLYP